MNSHDLPVEAPRAPVKEARAVVDEYLRIESQMMAPPSPCGYQLEAMRLGLSGDDDSRYFRSSQQADRRVHRFLRLTRVWLQLSREEQQVLRAQRTPSGSADSIHQVPTGDLVRLARLGVEILGVARRLDGEPVQADPGCIFVSESRPIYPTLDDVAELVGLTRSQVRSRVQSGLAKVREQIVEWD